MQASQLLKFRQRRSADHKRQEMMEDGYQRAIEPDLSSFPPDQDNYAGLTQSFVRLYELPTCPLDRLNRYEAALWRQAGQILFVLHALDHKSSWGTVRR